MTNTLGDYLRNRRLRMDPVALGFGRGRRRTPGLRREEVAMRANISPTWYTWLEQGRGGAPSAAVLDRIAAGLMLTDAERDHLFLLGLGRLPDILYRPAEHVTPRLQRILNALDPAPALIKNTKWDVLAWNQAARVLFADYDALAPENRNALRLLFGDARIRAQQENWPDIARMVVGMFRADVARAGATLDEEVVRLIAELSATSDLFATLWRESDVATPSHGTKRLTHPEAGTIDLEFSTLSVDGRPELALLVYMPATDEDAARIRSVLPHVVNGV